jgi:hypothetical protein
METEIFSKSDVDQQLICKRSTHHAGEADASHVVVARDRGACVLAVFFPVGVGDVCSDGVSSKRREDSIVIVNE